MATVIAALIPILRQAHDEDAWGQRFCWFTRAPPFPIVLILSLSKDEGDARRSDSCTSASDQNRKWSLVSAFMSTPLSVS